MKKKRTAVSLIAGILFVGMAALMIENGKLRHTRQELRDEINAALEENGRLQEQIDVVKNSVDLTREDESADSAAQAEDVNFSGKTIPAAELSLIDEGYAERIRTVMSAEDMVVLGVYPVGEDTQENMKRFFLCDGRYYMECYLADYITGEITNLSDRMPMLDISYYAKDQDGEIVTAYEDWEIRAEDYDGDGETDVLLVASFNDENTKGAFYHVGGIMLWLQREGEFLPVNRAYCGNYTYYGDEADWKESDFSTKINELEKRFREEKNPDDWNIDKIGAWVREELLAGQTENLNKEFQYPKKQLPYSQWREPLNLHPELMQDKEEHYSVSIPENPYSENRINEWLTNFYEKDKEREKRFMGVIREDEETMTEQERQEAGFYYSSSVWPERVDDTVICLMISVYDYSGGAHGNDYTSAVVFDTRSGEVLQLDDVIENREHFIVYAMDYIKVNYEPYEWETEEIKDSILHENWCFTDYGFKVFWNGINGLGIYECEIPYELFTDYLREEYLPISPAAEKVVFETDYKAEEG